LRPIGYTDEWRNRFTRLTAFVASR
jgi:hypothetical protein